MTRHAMLQAYLRRSIENVSDTEWVASDYPRVQKHLLLIKGLLWILLLFADALVRAEGPP